MTIKQTAFHLMQVYTVLISSLAALPETPVENHSYPTDLPYEEQEPEPDKGARFYKLVTSQTQFKVTM